VCLCALPLSGNFKLKSSKLWSGPRIVRHWTSTDVWQWLTTHGVPQASADLLHHHSVDGEALIGLYFAALRGERGSQKWAAVTAGVSDEEARATPQQVVLACERLEVLCWALSKHEVQLDSVT
jgi:hypothetical protein